MKQKFMNSLLLLMQLLMFAKEIAKRNEERHAINFHE
jgi:hypothetical protein